MSTFTLWSCPSTSPHVGFQPCGRQSLYTRSNSSSILYCWIWFANILKLLFHLFTWGMLVWNILLLFRNVCQILVLVSYWPHKMSWAFILSLLNHLCKISAISSLNVFDIFHQWNHLSLKFSFQRHLVKNLITIIHVDLFLPVLI